MNTISKDLKEFREAIGYVDPPKKDPLQKRLEAVNKRLERLDKGKRRMKYSSKLPAYYKSILYKCNKLGIKCEVTPKEFEAITKQSCFYCSSTSKTYISRVDGSGDYTADNLIPVCSKCSMIKNFLKHEEFIKLISKIYSNLQSKNCIS